MKGFDLRRIQGLAARGLLNWMPDRVYLRILYKARMGKKLNLKNPKTFNEKLQWLKLYDRRPEYTTMVDKYEAKKYVAELIGQDYIIPTLGVWDRFEDINFESLPQQFVLKCTHDSGGLVIVRDKTRLDFEAARARINRSLKCDYFWTNREWPYKNVKPRVIAEKYMVDESDCELKDYRFFCFDGFAKAMFIATDRASKTEETKFDFHDMDFMPLPCTNGHPNASYEIKRPASFEKMKELAEKLSQDLPHVFVDFYDINGQVYFGELTFSHWSGMVQFVPEEWDRTFGDWIKLPENIGGGYLIASKGYILWVHERKEKTNSLTDYKFYCFNGEPKFLYISQGLENHATASISFLTLDWQFAPYERNDYKPFSQVPSKPSRFEEMLEISRELSNGIPFLRVDLYQIGQKVYFSELTFTPCSGFIPFKNEMHDTEIGKMLQLPQKIRQVRGNDVYR